MADERKIVIELTAVGTDDDDDDAKNDEEKEAKKRQKKIKSVVKQLGAVAFREITTQALYDLEKYTSLSDDYKTSITVSNIKATVNKVMSLGKSTFAAAKLGFEIGGGQGAAIGAVIGAGVTITTEALSLIRQYETQSLNLRFADTEAKYARTRLGLIDNGRGTQN